MSEFIYVIYKEGYKDLAVFNSYAEANEAAEEREGDDIIDAITKERLIKILKALND